MNDDSAHSRFGTGLTNVRVNFYGKIAARQSRIDDTGVAAYFTLNGEQVCIPGDRWVYLQDNINAIALAIGALRGLERWGAKQMVDQAFRGFAALPAWDAPAWREVLEVSRTATRQEIEAAYWRQVRMHQADAGGDPEQFLRVKAAYENALIVVA